MFSDPEFRDILDGGTLWLDSEAMNTGPLYVEGAKNWTAHIAQLRATFGANFDISAGNYLRLSSGPCMNMCPRAAFKAILENSVELYDTGEIVGMDIFSGIWMARIPSISPKMNASTWQLSTMFNELVFPWLGEATGTVIDAAGKPVVGALVVVTYGDATPVTRKLTAADGTITWGGWSGKARPVPHHVTVSTAGHADEVTTVQLVGQTTVSFKVSLGGGGLGHAHRIKIDDDDPIVARITAAAPSLITKVTRVGMEVKFPAMLGWVPTTDGSVHWLVCGE